ncbi:MAG: hypothetical protein IKU46_11475 [Peptococcaceae bacterium]|nr:hypothetical protein [Peptococcaceae bacterium]
MEKQFICPNCPNHCQVTYTFQNGSIVDMKGCPCPKGMMTLLAELLPMNQKTDSALPKEQSCKAKTSMI